MITVTGLAARSGTQAPGSLPDVTSDSRGFSPAALRKSSEYCDKRRKELTITETIPGTLVRLGTSSPTYVVAEPDGGAQDVSRPSGSQSVGRGPVRVARRATRSYAEPLDDCSGGKGTRSPNAGTAIQTAISVLAWVSRDIGSVQAAITSTMAHTPTLTANPSARDDLPVRRADIAIAATMPIVSGSVAIPMRIQDTGAAATYQKGTVVSLGTRN